MFVDWPLSFDEILERKTAAMILGTLPPESGSEGGPNGIFKYPYFSRVDCSMTRSGSVKS